MTLVENAVKTLIKHGFDAHVNNGYGSLIVVNLKNQKVVLHHFDVYQFLNKHLPAVGLRQS
jgi:UTP-glucose-1-phosphate uridylyltransferase